MVDNVIKGFFDDSQNTTDIQALADTLYQEAIRIGMELNNTYHTPEELREIMSRLIGKKVDDTFRLFPPFYTDFGKNVFINSGCHFRRCRKYGAVQYDSARLSNLARTGTKNYQYVFREL